MELKIEYIAVEDLKPYEKNNKKHEDFDVGEIAKSIDKYGMVDPIGIWEGNVIIEGHGRLLACKKLGIDKVPCIRLDHLTDEQRREYAIVHNKSQELAMYDFDNLADELAELDLSDFEFDFGLDKKKDKKEVEGEVPFTEVLGEESNYIVLKFNDEVDWLQLESLFDLPQVKAFSSRTDGKISKNMQRIGVGRVVDGAEFLNKLGVDL
jgi:hypothetical protein